MLFICGYILFSSAKDSFLLDFNSRYLFKLVLSALLTPEQHQMVVQQYMHDLLTVTPSKSMHSVSIQIHAKHKIWP